MGAALRVVLLAAFMVGQIAAGASVAGIDTWVGNEDNVDLPQGRRLALLVVGLARRGVFENVLRALTLNVVEPVGVTEVDVYVHLEPAVEGENKTFTAAELTECLATLLPVAVVRASVILPAGAGRATLGQRFGGHAAGGWKHHEHHQLQFRSLQELFGMALDQERQAQARYAYVARVRTDTLMLAAWPKVSEDWAALLPPHSVGGPGYATRGHRSDKFYIAPRSSSFRVFMLLPLHFTWRVAATDAWEALGCGEREETEDFILANCDRWGCPRGGGARGCEVCCGDVTWGVGSPLMCPEVLLPVAWQRMGLVLVDACALTGHFAVQGRHHPFEHYCRPLPPSPALADANAEAGGSVSQRTHTWPTRLGSRHPVTAAPPHLALRHAAAILVSRGTRGDDVAGAAVAGAAGVCAGQWVRFDVWMSHLLPGVGYTLVAELEGPGWLLPASTSLTAIQTHAHLFLDLRWSEGVSIKEMNLSVCLPACLSVYQTINVCVAALATHTRSLTC